MFDDFERYARFFLLDDLVTDDYRGVRFFVPFDDFTTPALPGTVEAYRSYRDVSAEFIEARNRRIGRPWLSSPPLTSIPCPQRSTRRPH